MSGLVYLVGAGPGDPGLITLKGLNAIKKADVIIYDRLVNMRLLQYARVDSEQFFVGKSPQKHEFTQEEINQLLVDKAKEGKIVVRLKGGDPFIFGRGGEELQRCKEENILVEVVPGVTSAIAVPAYAGIPVTHREINSSFTIISGHENPEKTETSIQWEKVSTATETIIFLMGVSNLPFIVQQLICFGRTLDTPIALVRWGTRAEQKTIVGTLKNIVQKVKDEGFSSPAVIIVGNVVNLRETSSWFEQKPLFGKRILVTRAREQCSLLSEKIEELGGEVYEFPVIRITPSKGKELDGALNRIAEYDWIIFTSVNGVKYFLRRLKELKIDIRKLANARIGAIGPKTADSLLNYGLLVEVIPELYQAEALMEKLKDKVQFGQHILLPRSNIARKLLAVQLEECGCHVTEVDTYDTGLVCDNAIKVVNMILQNEIHVITFTSSSTVKNFIQAIQAVYKDYLNLLGNTKIACIGPITANTAKKFGLNVTCVANTYTIEGLIDSIQHI